MLRALLERLFVPQWEVQWHLYLFALLLPVSLVVVAEYRLRRRD